MEGTESLSPVVLETLRAYRSRAPFSRTPAATYGPSWLLPNYGGQRARNPSIYWEPTGKGFCTIHLTQLAVSCPSARRRSWINRVVFPSRNHRLAGAICSG